VKRKLLLLSCCLAAVVGASGQDPMRVHPESYKVEIDNPHVRVVRRCV
jgi:hypothetical protein